jgi:hypothetical protein|tara:strand:+ start:513 stop:725 length:213 start_codon:yes stop_codon:yes gene_type:complete
MISTIKKTFKEGREYVKLGELTKADESFDMCIAQLAEATLKGSKEIEGASVDLWKSRVWVAIEKAGLLPD